MDAVVYGALEEICSQLANGLTLRGLWSKIPSHLSSNGLHLCTNVKKALWSNLLTIPSLQFECKGVWYKAEDPNIQSFEDAEAMDLKIVAAAHLLDSFVGIYDIKASDAEISLEQRRALDCLAIARTDGVTQNELVKALGIPNNKIYYVLRHLETRGLIVRQSTMIRNKETGNDGDYNVNSIINTNMLHLHRYAKHLGNLQRLEITKEYNTDRVVTEDGVSEQHIKEDIHVKDYVPALKAICDRLEKADGKVLVVPDIKKELGYRLKKGHRAWNNILNRLKDAHLVEEFQATVNQKEVKCLRLLKSFSTKDYESKDDDLTTEQLIPRGQITEQLLELPIEQQIYDMIDAEGSKGLIINDVYKRLGINNKRYYPRILNMQKRFHMHIDSESLNKGHVYRCWTSKNYNTKSSSSVPDKSEASNSVPDKSENTTLSNRPLTGQLTLTHTTQEPDHPTPKVNIESSQKHNIDTNGIIVNSEPPSNMEISSPVSPPLRVRRSYTQYPCLGFSTTSSKREQRILEKLQEEKVLIKPELQRVLDSLENLDNKYTSMDRKTLARSLNKLQEEGHCKCISYAVPSVTNCGRKRTIDVILHPSVYKAEDLSDIVHEKIRSFEKLIRTPCFPQNKSINSKPIPVLNNIERIPLNRDSQTETFIAMRENGFVLAKMVRAKLLHVFLWSNLSGICGWDDGIVVGQGLYEEKNPYSSCRLFDLDLAIKSMPLELFLQVAGSPVKLDSMVEKCRNGIRLSDLPIPEYRLLMETRATARLSYLIDILRRLKLIRLIDGEVVENSRVGPHTTTLRHSLELKPYIEEPVTVVLPSPGVTSFDLRPHVRHDFVLASRKGVEEYWNTLEYSYFASDPKAALHAFPGSAVHEVFHVRAWTAVRVMTAHQRAELSKLVANDDSTTKITYKKCEKITENLNLTLEQVLRVYYDKRQKSKSKRTRNTKGQDSQPPTNTLITYKRKRSSKGKKANNDKTLIENLLEESSKVKKTKLFLEEDNETHMSTDDVDGQKEVEDDAVAVNEDADTQSYSLSKLPIRTKRFAWTETTDRLLVIEYVRHRASLGAKFHRAEWSSLENLPAPPETCRRRMSTLNRNNQFRKAVMRLCNMLSVRYAKHLEHSKNKTLIDNRKAPEIIPNSNEMDVDEQWDDFDNNEEIKTALDEVLQYKQVSKYVSTKGARFTSPRSNEFEETSKRKNEFRDIGPREACGKLSRRRYLPKQYDELLNKGNSFGTQTYKSLPVSNAIELFKLIFLNTAKAPGVPNLLAETLRRYSEHDLFTAFNYLRDRKFMVRGNDASHFVLSQQFLHGISSSPFPVNTGKRAGKMGRWIQDELLENGVDLPDDLQCGDVVKLCVMMCHGEVAMSPCLPDEGIGEVEKLKKRKCDGVEKAKKQKLLDSEIFSRKEKGFPDIQLTLARTLIPRIDLITLSLEHRLSSSTCGHVASSSSSCESTWEAMTCYARHVASSSGQEESTINPDMFKSVYAAIQKAGDQGLSMEGISQIIDVEGEKMGEVIVEVLEAFGCALKVDSYDCVHVVDAVYRSKYFLSHQPDIHLKDNDKLQQEIHKDEGKRRAKEISTDIEMNTPTPTPDPDEEVQHRVTILNHPQQQLPPQPLRETSNSNETETNKNKFCISDYQTPSYKPILPWVNGDGSINEIVFKGLVRRVLGIIMQNPGILEDNIVSQMNVLNPQSCRKLLELMILDGHIRVRKMYESVSNGPPAMLSGLFGSNFEKPNVVFREHLFANPTGINCL